MEADLTESNCKRRGLRRFTERPLAGRLYEALAYGHCRQMGWKVLKTNLQLPVGEIDLLAFDGNVLWVVEVRGRAKGRPYHFLTTAKRNRLQRLRSWIEGRYRKTTLVYFMEFEGRVTEGGLSDWTRLFRARYFPDSFKISYWGYPL